MEILKRNTLLTYKNQNNYDLFKEYLETTVQNIFSITTSEMPKDIKVGDTIQTKYCDTATVISINSANQTLKLDTEIQNDITIFTDVITKVISPQEDIEVEL